MTKDNYNRVREWLHTITRLNGDSLAVVSKLEAASGIDIEDIADGAKLMCEDDSCEIRFEFRAYGASFLYVFPIIEDGAKYLLNKTRETQKMVFDEHGKAMMLASMLIRAMRSVPREQVIKQSGEFLSKQQRYVSKRLATNSGFQKEVEHVFSLKKDDDDD